MESPQEDGEQIYWAWVDQSLTYLYIDGGGGGGRLS